MPASPPPNRAALAHRLITLCLIAAPLSVSACGDDTTPNTTATNTNNTSTDGTATNNATQPDPPTAWRYVLIQDQGYDGVGEFSGADIDAIELIAEDGVSHFATTIEDFGLGRSSADDPSQALGEPNANCDANSGKFVSLGVYPVNGYIIVGFSSDGQDVAFGAGATIIVHELGGSSCGNNTYDPYAVSISASVNRDTFVQIGTYDDTHNFPVTTNP